MMAKSQKSTRKLKRQYDYIPCVAMVGEEIYPNGIFKFNITCILEHIGNGNLSPEFEELEVRNWHTNTLSVINEAHLPSVDCSQPVILGEISPGRYNIIDGHHRIEKAHRKNLPYVPAYKLKMEQLINYFIDLRGYNAFVDYWNSKLESSF
jgi:hypothetical protein